MKFAWRPVAVHARGQHRVQSCKIWTVALSIVSASLQMAQNYKEQLIRQRVMLPFRGTWKGWRNGQTGTS